MINSKYPPKLVLASTSRYRSRALRQLGVEFEQVGPAVDEARHADESPADMAGRLAREKAHAVFQNHQNAVVIGSDQVGYCRGEFLNKPGSRSLAVAQLRHCSGQQASFYSAVVVQGPASVLSACVVTDLVFRELNQRQIEHYVEHDRAWDCAGSFKLEAMGIVLFEQVSSSDPTAIIGLPLIATTSLLAEFGISPLG